MKSLRCFVVALFLSVLTMSFSHAQTTDEVVALVQHTKKAAEENALQTLARINRAEDPYRDADNPSLYVFVLDTDLTVIAHPIRTPTIGTSMKGKPDAKGKMFRDEMLAIALKDGGGWVDYHFINPKTNELAHKTSYFELVRGSDGKDYIIGSGKYFED
jgi:signal transduction histidine kinase